MDFDRPARVKALAVVLEANPRDALGVVRAMGRGDSMDVHRLLQHHGDGDCSAIAFCTHTTWAIASECVDLVEGVQ